MTRLKKTITRLRLQQVDVAAALGATPLTISNWALGKTTMSAVDLISLRDYLRGYDPAIEVDDLVGEAAS